MCLDCLFWCLDLVFGFDCGFSGFGVGDLFLVVCCVGLGGSGVCVSGWLISGLAAGFVFGISGSFVVVGISGLCGLGFGFLGCVGCTCGFCGGFSGISVALCWVLGLLVFVFERSTWCAWVAVGGYS